MDDAELGIEAALQLAQRGARDVDQRVFVARIVGDAEHAGRLVDHHHVGVDVDDGVRRERALPAARPGGIVGDAVAGRDAGGRIVNDRVVDAHPAAPAQVARLVPRERTAPVFTRLA
jgi:hypothetical protein